jgi:hypothetical protein
MVAKEKNIKLLKKYKYQVDLLKMTGTMSMDMNHRVKATGMVRNGKRTK